MKLSKKDLNDQRCIASDVLCVLYENESLSQLELIKMQSSSMIELIKERKKKGHANERE
jgi:hypothetical protein